MIGEPLILAEVTETPEAPGLAEERLKAMGPLSRDEIVTFATILGAVVLWVFGDALGIPAVQAAMLALSTLLATGTPGLRGTLVPGSKPFSFLFAMNWCAAACLSLLGGSLSKQMF